MKFYTILALSLLAGFILAQNQVTVARYKLVAASNVQDWFYSMYLIETRSAPNHLTCIANCNLNFACRMASYENISTSCALFSQSPAACNTNSSSSVNLYIRNKPGSCDSTQISDGWSCNIKKSYGQTCDNSTCQCDDSAGLTCSTVNATSTCDCKTPGHRWSESAKSCVACLAGWTASSTSCIKFFTGNYNYTSAAEFCRTQNAYLVDLEPPEKFALVSSMYRNDSNTSALGHPSVWVNGSTTIPFVFTWYNGHAINPAYWGAKQPDNNNYNATELHEGCLDLFIPDGYTLNDDGCYWERDVYCEYF